MKLGKKQVGIYGGSFNPPHNGHLNLATEIAEKKGLDEVWFCPAKINPFKASENSSSIQDRLTMTYLAIEAYKNFKVIEVEAGREGVSYTIDTIQELTAAFGKEVDFSLIIGADNIYSFPQWRHAELIVEMLPILVGRRRGEELALPSCSMKIMDALQAGAVPTRIMEISATEIRNRIKQRLVCAHLVPGKVIDYIKEHSLYSL